MKKGLVLGSVLAALIATLGLGSAACTADEPAIMTTANTAAWTAAMTTSTTVETISTTTSTTVQTSSTSTSMSTTTTAFSQEPMTLRFATTSARDEVSGRTIRRFIDRVEKATDGAVTFDVFFDGMLGGTGEELELVGSGFVDMVSLRLSVFPDRLPLLYLPDCRSVEGRKVVDCLDHIAFQNRDTVRLIHAEARANNITYIGFIAGDVNVFVGCGPVAALADLAGMRFGAAAPTSALEALDVMVVETSSAGIYEALAGDVVDVTRAGFFKTLNLKWYEPVTHYVWDGTCSGACALTVNLRTWARLSPETQEVFREAALDAEAFSSELSAAEVRASTGTLEKAGVTFGSLSPEDQAAWSLLLFEDGASGSMSRAVTLGITSDMTVVLSAAAAFSGLPWAPPAG
ncbi:MAG: TRAP transporter substrate-binding protein DctP [Actinobacteria bacterium]|jgi:TRAP-type C4-dicarboxylate transport system substrate-binding protein|nr:TRAP transporter substrate-binding protein DctP [Actinomycetota bacterium]